VIATLHLNGDYLSDALAAQVGGIGIAPEGNITMSRARRFEATHGTDNKGTPDIDKVNQGSVILSGEMNAALSGLGSEGLILIMKGLATTIKSKSVSTILPVMTGAGGEMFCVRRGDVANM